MRVPIQGVYQDGAGNIVVSGDVKFYEYNDSDEDNPTTIATIYAAQTGGSAIATGTVQTNSNGVYIAWVETTDYIDSDLFTLVLSKSTHVDIPYHFTIPGLPGLSALIVHAHSNAASGGNTLTTPTIADLSNATHNHSNNAGGGNTLTTPTIADLSNATHNHSNNAGGGNTLTPATVVATSDITTSGGLFKMGGGSPSVGKVLTSDAVGLCSWSGVVEPLSGEGHVMVPYSSYSSITQGTWAVHLQDAHFGDQVFRNQSFGDSDRINYKVFLATGTYTFSIFHLKDSIFGILDVLFDGVSKGTIDFYNGSTNPNQISNITGITVASSGLVEIGLLINGKNGSSTNYYINYSHFVLFRTA